VVVSVIDSILSPLDREPARPAGRAWPKAGPRRPLLRAPPAAPEVTTGWAVAEVGRADVTEGRPSVPAT